MLRSRSAVVLSLASMLLTRPNSCITRSSCRRSSWPCAAVTWSFKGQSSICFGLHSKGFRVRPSQPCIAVTQLFRAQGFGVAGFVGRVYGLVRQATQPFRVQGVASGRWVSGCLVVLVVQDESASCPVSGPAQPTQPLKVGDCVQ